MLRRIEPRFLIARPARKRSEEHRLPSTIHRSQRCKRSPDAAVRVPSVADLFRSIQPQSTPQGGCDICSRSVHDYRASARHHGPWSGNPPKDLPCIPSRNRPGASRGKEGLWRVCGSGPLILTRERSRFPGLSNRKGSDHVLFLVCCCFRFVPHSVRVRVHSEASHL